MRKLIVFLIFTSFELSLFSQKNTVDSLILNINNGQLSGTCHYAWVLEMNSSAGDLLIKMGKSSVNKLYPLLDSKEKGIIVHYILSNIFGGILSCKSSFEHFDRDSTIDYEYNGLKFFEKNENIFTIDSILVKNKLEWIEKIKKNDLENKGSTLLNDKAIMKLIQNKK